MLTDTRMIPAIALGGPSSVLLTKGLFITWRGLKCAIQRGIDTLTHHTEDVDVVPAPLRLEPTSNAPIFRTQRKGASCGFLLLTRTGIFYVQSIELNVFKAQSSGQTAPLLSDYQKQTTKLGAKAYQLYSSAVGAPQNGTEHEFENTCHIILLHMLLNDIQVRIHKYKTKTLPMTDYASFKRVACDLVEKALKGGKSKDILAQWQKNNTQLQQNWQKWMCGKDGFYSTALGSDEAEDARIGIKEWNVIDPFFMCVKKKHMEWEAPADIEPESREWLLLGQMAYTLR